jgi:NAD+ diphosphatase
MESDPFKAALNPMDVGFIGSPLDRADHLRSDSDALKALRAGPKARFAAFADLRPIVDLSTGQPGLLWLTASKGGYQRICESNDCKAEHFPRTDPVVIMLVIDGDRCLLGRQPKFPPGFYSSLAGFIEPGESIEEAVAREVFEEAGIRIARVRYVASQPWPFPSSLMIGCFAEAITSEITIDVTELEDAKWFTKAETRAALAGDGPFRCPPPFAVSYPLLKSWAAL